MAHSSHSLIRSCTLLIGVICFFQLGCNHSPPVKGTKATKVVVTKPIVGRVVDYQDFTGRIEAVKSVDVRARVTGYLKEVLFQEGDFVNEGEPLYQIEKKPYQLELDQAEANHKLALADLNQMTQNADRARRMWATKSMSREEYDAATAALEKASAQIAVTEAAKDRAKLFLGYTRVTSPISGRISRKFVDPGNLVLADNTILTTVVSEDPVYAYFDVDERTYLELPNASQLNRRSVSTASRSPVLMRLANEEHFQRDKIGQVDFVDNRVVATTGTVRMRGIFPNTSGTLKAGLFVRVRLPIGEPYDAILIPGEAIQSDQERKYVWVVNAKNEVEYRSVTLGQAIRSGKTDDPRDELRVIRPPESSVAGKEGLTTADSVIVSGMQRVRKGIVVEAETQAPTSPPDIPLVKLLTKTS